MNIVTSLNQKYVKYAYVMMTSVLENNEEPIHFFLLQSDLTASDHEIFSSLTEKYGCEITYLDIDASRFSSDLITTSDNWSLEAYFRLLLIQILPDEIDRILYLDVDIIVNKPLTDLYYQDFEGNNFCVCREITFDGSFPDYRQQVFADLLEKGYDYFNSGVMLWNIENLRKQNYTFDRYMEVARAANHKLLAFDQDVLNLTHHGEIKYVDEYLYDLFPRFAYASGIHYEDVVKETVILHFTGEKPWQGKYIHYDIEQIWWDYAKKTPFYQEFMETFLQECLASSFVYDIVKKQSDEIQKVQAFLQRLVK